MRITKRSNIAMRVLMFCGVHQERLVTKAEIAERCNTSESHLAQVINQLAQLGYLDTHRGRNGGIRLGRPMARIAVGEVFRVMEADAPLAECFADVDNTCPLTDACRLREAIGDAAEAFYRRLDKVTLAELVCGNTPLADLLGPFRCGRTGAETPEPVEHCT